MNERLGPYGPTQTATWEFCVAFDGTTPCTVNTKTKIAFDGGLSVGVHTRVPVGGRQELSPKLVLPRTVWFDQVEGDMTGGTEAPNIES